MYKKTHNIAPVVSVGIFIIYEHKHHQHTHNQRYQSTMLLCAYLLHQPLTRSVCFSCPTPQTCSPIGKCPIIACSAPHPLSLSLCLCLSLFHCVCRFSHRVARVVAPLPPSLPTPLNVLRWHAAGFQIYPPPTTPPEPAPPDHHMAPSSMMRPYKGGGRGGGGGGVGGGHTMVSASQSSLDDITCKNTKLKSFCNRTRSPPHNIKI